MNGKSECTPQHSDKGNERHNPVIHSVGVAVKITVSAHENMSKCLQLCV